MARAAGALPVLPALEEVGVFAEHALERRLPPAAASSGRTSGHRARAAAAAPAAEPGYRRPAGDPPAGQGAGGRGARRGGAAAAAAAAVAAPAAVCALGRPLHGPCAPGTRVPAAVAAPALELPARRRRRRPRRLLLQLPAPGPRVAAPNPREMPDSYRRKRRRRRRAGKEANGAGCSCGAPPSAAAPAPAPPSALVSSSSSERVAGSASPPRVPLPLLSSPSGRPGPGAGGAAGRPAAGWARPVTLAFLLPPPLGSGGARGNLRALLPSPSPPRDLGGGAAPPTGAARIWSRPACHKHTRTVPLPAFRTEPGPDTRTRQPGNEPHRPSKVTGRRRPPGPPAGRGGEWREGRRCSQVSSPGLVHAAELRYVHHGHQGPD